jgi:hypothetical protein
MGTTGSWDEATASPDELAAALGLTVPDPKTMRMKVLQSSLRSRVNPAPMAARPTVAPVAPDAEAPTAAVPAGPDFNTQRARIEAELEELNQPKDLSALQSEGKRRGTQGTSSLLMALAAQQAGPEFGGIQQHMLRQAMAARDPLKFSGGIVNEEGQVVEDPNYKAHEKRLAYERRLAGIDRGENAAAMAAAERARREEATRMNDQRARELQADRLQQSLLLKSMTAAGKSGAGAGAGGASPGKTMTPGNIMKIAEMEKSVGATERLASEFKPEFAGAKGAAMTAVGSLPFASTDAAEWWRNYRREEELIKRHELFGATLTGSEGAAWRAADVNPTMDSGQIAARLARRAQIERDAYTKMLGKLQQGGWNVPGASDAPAASAAPPAAAPAPAGGGWSVKVKGQ